MCIRDRVSGRVSAKSKQSKQTLSSKSSARCSKVSAQKCTKSATKRNRIQAQQIPGKMGIQCVLCEQDWTRCNQDLTGIQSAVSGLVSSKQAAGEHRVNNQTEVLRDGCTDEVTRMVTPQAALLNRECSCQEWTRCCQCQQQASPPSHQRSHEDHTCPLVLWPTHSGSAGMYLWNIQ